jgi:GT2 family glycosyltransferase
LEFHPELSLVIPTWNGRELLKEFLSSIAEACRYYSGLTEIVVVDDGSTDGTQEFLKKEFPDIRVLRLIRNHGYGYASNFGVAQCRYDGVVLLNNDVFVKQDFLQYLPSHLAGEDVFAVRIRVFRLTDKEALESGRLKPGTPWIRGEVKNGFIRVPSPDSCPLDEAPDQGRYVFSVGAGAFAVCRKKWLQLGGFDSLFAPFYCEETDLAYRALKRGFKIIYEPRSQAYHKEGNSTVRKAKKSWYIDLVGERNRYFFMWKNMTDLRLLREHIGTIPPRLLRNLFTGKPILCLSFFCALWGLPRILSRRRREKKEARVSDGEILRYFNLKKKGSSSTGRYHA